MYQYSQLPTYLENSNLSHLTINAGKASSDDEIAPLDAPNAGPYVGEGVEVNDPNSDEGPQIVDPEDDEINDDEHDEADPNDIEDLHRADDEGMVVDIRRKI